MSTDWNERSSRSHLVFCVIIKLCEWGEGNGSPTLSSQDFSVPGGRVTPSLGVPLPTPGGPRLQLKGGRSVQSRVLVSLFHLLSICMGILIYASEGKYINASLLMLGSITGMLTENAAKGKS